MTKSMRITPEAMPLSEAKRKLLEQYLSQSRTKALDEGAVIPPRPSGEPAPLSLSQEQLWLRERTTPGIPALYNECITVRMPGPLEIPALERSVTEIIRRHEIWRTTYDTRNGQPVQIIHPAPDGVRLPLLDLRSLPSDRREAEAHRVISEIVRQPFDLKQGPLLRFRLIRMGDFEFRLSLCAHLSIVDGVSAYQVFPSELAILYKAFSSGQASVLPHLAVQFGDYAYWQRQWLQGEEQAKQLAYWKKQLGGKLPVLNWPATSPLHWASKFRGAIRRFALPKSVSEKLKELSQKDGTTLFTTLAAGLATLLHRYTQQEDIIVGTPSPAGRKRFEVEKLLGYFLNPVALRFDLSGDPSFRGLVRQTQELTLEALSNDDIPLEWLARQMQPNVDPVRHPFFTVAMSLQPPMPALDLGWSVTSMDADSGGAPWELYIAFISQPAGIAVRVQYNPDLFDTETITRMLNDYQRVLEFMCAHPFKRLSQVVLPSSRT
jgi:surfactin family lipopeptide synthetase A